MPRTVVFPVDSETKVDISIAKGPKFIVERETGKVVGMIARSHTTNLWGTSDGSGGLTGWAHISEKAAINSLQKSKYKIVVEITI